MKVIPFAFLASASLIVLQPAWASSECTFKESGPLSLSGACSNIIAPIYDDSPTCGVICTDFGGNALLKWKSTGIGLGEKIHVTGNIKVINMFSKVMVMEGSFYSQSDVVFVAPGIGILDDAIISGGNVVLIAQDVDPEQLEFGLKNPTLASFRGTAWEKTKLNVEPLKYHLVNYGKIQATTGNVVLGSDEISNEHASSIIASGTVEVVAGIAMAYNWNSVRWLYGRQWEIGYEQCSFKIIDDSKIKAAAVRIEAHRQITNTGSQTTIVLNGDITASGTMTLMTGAGKVDRDSSFSTLGIVGQDGFTFNIPNIVVTHYKFDPVIGGTPRTFDTSIASDVKEFEDSIGGGEFHP